MLEKITPERERERASRIKLHLMTGLCQEPAKGPAGEQLILTFHILIAVITRHQTLNQVLQRRSFEDSKYLNINSLFYD